MHRAARLGDHDEIRRLAESGVPIDEPFNIRSDPHARECLATPLMVAAGSGDGATADTVRLLLECGASIQPGPPGVSALSLACAGLDPGHHATGDAERIAVLLRAGSDPNVRGYSGDPALASAARSGDPEWVQLLLDAGADPAPDPAGLQTEREAQLGVLCLRSALHRAAASGSDECVRMLLAAGAPAYDDGVNHSILACATSTAMLGDLLEAGADPHGPGQFRSSIADSIAFNRDVTVGERASMLRALTAAGVDLDRGAPMSTAIARRAMNGDDAGVEALLAAGADPRAGNALASACFSYSNDRDPGIERVIDLLIAAGFDANEHDADGYTPLHQALSPDAYGDGYQESDDINVAAAAALIRHGASVDIVYPNFGGYGPLHVAALQRSAPAIDMLLAAGADPNQRNPAGETPLDVARAQLTSAGSDASQRDAARECERALETATGIASR